jgi:hypothetical protein
VAAAALPCSLQQALDWRELGRGSSSSHGSGKARQRGGLGSGN